MSYLIYDEVGELIDVLPLTTPEEIKAYKHLNPSHSLELADSELEEQLLSDAEDDEDYFSDEDEDDFI